MPYMLYSVRPIRKLEGSAFGQVLSSPPSKQPPKDRDPFLEPVKRSMENQVSTLSKRKEKYNLYFYEDKLTLYYCVWVWAKEKKNIIFIFTRTNWRYIIVYGYERWFSNFNRRMDSLFRLYFYLNSGKLVTIVAFNFLWLLANDSAT